jgi:hypothetical protein
VPEPDMNGIIHIYHKMLKKKGFIVNLGWSSWRGGQLLNCIGVCGMLESLLRYILWVTKHSLHNSSKCQDFDNTVFIFTISTVWGGATCLLYAQAYNAQGCVLEWASLECLTWTWTDLLKLNGLTCTLHSCIFLHFDMSSHNHLPFEDAHHLSTSVLDT